MKVEFKGFSDEEAKRAVDEFARHREARKAGCQLQFVVVPISSAEDPTVVILGEPGRQADLVKRILRNLPVMRYIEDNLGYELSFEVRRPPDAGPLTIPFEISNALNLLSFTIA